MNELKGLTGALHSTPFLTEGSSKYQLIWGIFKRWGKHGAQHTPVTTSGEIVSPLGAKAERVVVECVPRNSSGRHGDSNRSSSGRPRIELQALQAHIAKPLDFLSAIMRDRYNTGRTLKELDGGNATDGKPCSMILNEAQPCLI